MAQKKIELPIVAQPFEEQNDIDRPVVALINDNLLVKEAVEAENKNQIWIINY